MPSFLMQKRLDAKKGNTIGRALKYQSDMIMEATWDNDIASCVAYLYDQEHDEEFEKKTNLHPEKTSKIPVEVKFYEMTYNSLSKDDQAYHIMFKPSYKPNVPYYEEKFGKPLDATFPIGLYIDLPTSDGVYGKWLIVGQYRHYSNQFPSYLVLPCDHKLQWIYKGKKLESWCVLRSQNSYNSGVWSDYKITLPENQKITWFPFNDITKTIFYNQRVAISQDRETPVVWKCTKVEDMNVKGIARYTWAQDVFDEHKDFIERDKEGNLEGIWCDYYSQSVIPTTPTEPEENIRSEITYSGAKPEIKIKGGYKKFSVNFYRDEEPIDFDKSGMWRYTISDNDATDLLSIIEPKGSSDLQENQIKIKFVGNDSYLSKILTISYETATGVRSAVDVAITSL